jgi:drug/metabolite transporter (DMT)-like permease
MTMAKGVWTALIAAALFGASTPIAKTLLGDIPPVLLAGLFYAGSGLGLAMVIAVRQSISGGDERIWVLPTRSELKWLASSIGFGGIAGPILLLLGLQATAASVSALLLNLEPVFTALLAWMVFRENFDRRIAAGMLLIVLGGLALAWTPGDVRLSTGSLLVAAACFCWGVDNNLTRKVAANDAMTIACIKGLVAGAVNIGIAFAMGAHLPSWVLVTSAAVVGFAGYGISLTLFVIALRELGTARTGAYFSVAPFFGAMLALVVQHDPVTVALVAAALLMAAGIWLHVTEHHLHDHEHVVMSHMHPHTHDEHHRHLHVPDWNGAEPHTHLHEHLPLRHAHAHYPDIHHRHEH